MPPKKKPTWTFDEWFKAQHGARPTNIDFNLLRDRIRSQEAVLAMDKRKLALLETWEARRTTALYVWQIEDAQKKVR